MMADRTSPNRNFSVGIPLLPSQQRDQSTGAEDLRLIAQCYLMIFYLLLLAVVPWALEIQDFGLLSLLSSFALCFLLGTTAGRLMTSFLRIARRAEAEE